MTLTEVERVRVTTVVDNYIDILRPDEKVARRFSTLVARKIPDLRAELAQDTFIGEQTLIANVKGSGLVVVTSCSHRGIIGICQHATRITGVGKVHAVVGGFHLSGLSEERITRVVDAFRALEVDYVVPQHCSGIEAIGAIGRRLPNEMVASSVGSAFVFGNGP